MIGGQRVFQLNTNFTPRGLVPLEILFNASDVPLKPSMKLDVSNIEEQNLDTKEDPNLVKISKTLS
jgi:hypothetical protein